MKIIDCYFNDPIKTKRELEALTDSHKSFYKKAYVLVGEKETYLESYGTIVASFSLMYGFRIRNFYSSTTLRHLKEFAGRYAGCKFTSKKDLKKFLEEEN